MFPLAVSEYVYAARFRLASMGEDFASNLGMKYRQVVKLGLTIVALTTASVVRTVGMNPFVGLVATNVTAHI